MHRNERLCLGLADGAVALVAAPLLLVAAATALVAAPVWLPMMIASYALSAQRFNLLRTGDVIKSSHGNAFVVLRPPGRRRGGVLCAELFGGISMLREWSTADEAFTFFCRDPRRTLANVLSPCISRVETRPLVDLVAVIQKSYVLEQPHALTWRVRVATFELLRPVRLIQRAWREYRVRRREAAAREIARAILDFLYRPGGACHVVTAARWRALEKA
jgi:hypothetical protein